MKESKIKELKTITRETLNNILNTIVSEDANCFEKGELAYIMLQEKAERQIRDKVAWKLQQLLYKKDDRLLVCMEWCPTDWKTTDSSNKPRVDLAVLYLNDDKINYVDVLAMVEFKYYALLTDSEKTDKTDNFTNDILKMKEIANLPSKDSRYSESDIYYVVLQGNYKVLQGNHQCDSYSKKRLLYAPAIKYEYSNSQYNKVNKDSSHDFGRLVYECFDKYYNNTMGCEITTSEDLSKKGRKKRYPVVQVGESLGYSLQMSMMVWGPFYKDDYEVQ